MGGEIGLRGREIEEIRGGIRKYFTGIFEHRFVPHAVHTSVSSHYKKCTVSMLLV